MMLLSNLRPSTNQVNQFVMLCSSIQEIPVILEIGDKGYFPLCQRFRKFQLEVQLERSVSVPSNWNIRDHLWRWSTLTGQTKIPRSILTNQFVALLLFTYVRNHRKGVKKMVRAIPLGWPGFIGKCCSIFFGSSHLSLTGRSGIMESIQCTGLIRHSA